MMIQTDPLIEELNDELEPQLYQIPCQIKLEFEIILAPKGESRYDLLLPKPQDADYLGDHRDWAKTKLHS